MILHFNFLVFSPDPYVSAQVLGTPNGVKRTKHVPASSEPYWNETLEFYIDSSNDRFLGKWIVHFLQKSQKLFNIFLPFSEFVLFDLNKTVNEEIGREVVDFYGFPPDTDHYVTVSYKNVLLFKYTGCLFEREYFEQRYFQ